MKIKILTPQRIQHRFASEAIKEYTKRLSKYCKTEFIVTENIAKQIKHKTYIIEISKDGKALSSEQLAKKISTLGVSGNSDVAIILSDENIPNADFVLSISKMDMDTDLMLIVLYEQIYRAYRIIRNEPYHK